MVSRIRTSLRLLLATGLTLLLGGPAQAYTLDQLVPGFEFESGGLRFYDFDYTLFAFFTELEVVPDGGGFQVLGSLGSQGYGIGDNLEITFSVEPTNPGDLIAGAQLAVVATETDGGDAYVSLTLSDGGTSLETLEARPESPLASSPLAPTQDMLDVRLYGFADGYYCTVGCDPPVYAESEITSMSFQFSVVPEPAAAALLGGAIASIALFPRRHRAGRGRRPSR